MKYLRIFMLCFATFVIGFFVGSKAGVGRGARERGARQMARHLLNPAYQTRSFEIIVTEEKGDGYEPKDVEKYRRAALGWQNAAEHYGGICNWFLNNKPIYGKIEVGDNAILRNCLIVSGSSGPTIDVIGVDSLIANNYFMAIDMDWVLSTTPIDPNSRIELQGCMFKDIDPNGACSGITIIALPFNVDAKDFVKSDYYRDWRSY